MAAGGDKRALPIAILDILFGETDMTHGLQASEICEMLPMRFGLTATEKTVREHCKAFQAIAPFGREVVKLVQGDVVDGVKISAEDAGWAAAPYLDGSQTRLLADGLLLSRIETDELAELAKRLQRLSGASGRGIGYLKHLEIPDRVDAGFLANIDALNEAIARKCAVSCCYTHWTPDGALEPYCDRDGNPDAYVLDPYQMAYKNGRYFLICRPHGYARSNLSYYRIDRLHDVRLLPDEAVAPAEEALPGGRRFDVVAHMDERPYPYHGDKVRVKVRTNYPDAVFDWFTNVEATELPETVNGRAVLEATFEAVPEPTRWWALQYSDYVEVLEPPELRAALAASARRLAETYAT